ncbi:DJ-1/PfpI family protein [Streptomyces sp. ODS28]|uniref:DJ-1/PfpI family protein n=1 Tax=Streptomyces sp. ODS28 TaxID=3136688 RepID=UPI0031E88CA1
MKTAILLYDRFTALDAVGPYEVLSRLPGAETVFVAARPGPVTADTGALTLTAHAGLSDVPSADLLLVPGGPGQEALMEDAGHLEWLRAADATSAWTTSVCSGSLLLAAAGLLKGRRATSHWALAEGLTGFGAVPAKERVVIDGKYATAAGVSAGIDLALTLAGKIAGDATAQAVQLLVEYDPQPPYAAGNPATAPEGTVERVRELIRES